MRIGIYFDNSTIADVDLTHPEFGNPGIGATQYLIASFPYYFSKCSLKSAQCVLYVREAGRFPSVASIVRVSGLVGAAKASRQDGCDVFICLPPFHSADMEVFPAIERLCLPTIIWANNTPSADCLKQIHSSAYIKRLVCAGREGLDFLRDHPAFSKGTFIFNGIDVDLYAAPADTTKLPKTVVYMGSLVPAKGFHLLARVWPSIVRAVPDASLLVIGSGDL